MSNLLLNLHGFFVSVTWNVWFFYGGLLTFLWGFVGYGLWVKWREHTTHHPAREQFEEEYRQRENEDSREQLRRTIVRAYAAWKETHSQAGARIVDLVGLAPFPADLPLSNKRSLRQWADTVPFGWHGEARDLWNFSVALFPEDGSKSELLKDDYDSFWAARKATAKFWDRWGKSIERGELRREDIDHQLAAHKKRPENARLSGSRSFPVVRMG
ncbi:MAG: hypothetical protein L0Y56_12065 [Nitrospira sp.]|nr:hypothetical protein [Nitrospira sp.]